MKHAVEPEGITDVTPQYIPSIRVEISKEQADTLSIGKDAEITVKGRVTGLDINDRDQENGRFNLDLELKEVEILEMGDDESDPEDTEIADLLDDNE